MFRAAIQTASLEMEGVTMATAGQPSATFSCSERSEAMMVMRWREVMQLRHQTF